MASVSQIALIKYLKDIVKDLKILHLTSFNYFVLGQVFIFFIKL